ncbi:unnamed protein product [Heterosigma akashiwo]
MKPTPNCSLPKEITDPARNSANESDKACNRNLLGRIETRNHEYNHENRSKLYIILMCSLGLHVFHNIFIRQLQCFDFRIPWIESWGLDPSFNPLLHDRDHKPD